jgi:hypothetical protein
MSESGFDETWLDTDDLRIVTCRLTCGMLSDLHAHATL